MIDEEGSNLVTFRFLGLKTDRKRILFLVDMNRFLAPHDELVRATVVRAMESLQSGYRFAILGFQQQDSGPRYYRWPADGSLAAMTPNARAEAKDFLDGLAGRFQGASSVLSAFETAFRSDAGAIILMPDYQKEVRSLGDLEYLEALAGQTQAMLDRTRAGRE
ncbi:MAG: hypothetical protein P8Y52_13995, partial [Xanthomonadales bacterium]